MNLEENNGVPASPEPGSAERPEDGLESTVPSARAVLVASTEGREAADVQPAESESPTAAELDASPDADSESQPDDDSQASADESSPIAAPPHDEHERLKRHHVAPAMIALDRIDDDSTFQIRPVGDFSQLATDIARLGQLFPIDIRLKPPDRFQVICGFRRVAALRFLQRDRVLARLHTELDDEDALLMALVSAIHAKPVSPEELEAVKARYEREGRLSPSIRSMLDKALSPGDDLAPETVGDEEEIEADQLAVDVTLRLGEINQDLSLLADVFDSLDDARKDELLQQLRYSSDLVEYLEKRR